MNYSTFVRDVLKNRTVEKLKHYAEKINIISSQEELFEKVQNGILIGDYYLCPSADEIIDASKLLCVGGNLVVGGEGIVKLPKTPFAVGGNIFLFGRGDVDLKLIEPPVSIIIAGHNGDVNISVLPNDYPNVLFGASVSWVAVNHKVVVKGVEHVTSNFDVMFNRGDVRFPDVKSVDNAVLYNNWQPLMFYFESANNLRVEQNQESVNLSRLKNVTGDVFVNQNKAEKITKYNPRGAYVNLSHLRKCKELNCVDNDFVNLNLLEITPECKVERNKKICNQGVIRGEKGKETAILR